MDLGDRPPLLIPTLYGLDLEDLQHAVQLAGAPAYRARQVLGWVYQKHIRDWEEAGNLPAALRRALGERFVLSALELIETYRSGEGDSVKYLFRTRDGQFLESVLITQQGRLTVCVSTQIGCKMGCVFCASGKGKFGRNLTPGEIVEQVARIERASESRVTNVVFMGMGEPLDNFEAVMKALRILQAPWGFGIGARRITVSTVGIIPGILEFVRRSEGRVRLSVSLHSAHDASRTELVPVNKRYGLKELESALKKIHTRLKREITFEYTLIADRNDSPEEALALARLARPLKAKVNLIPYNPIREENFKRPESKKIEKFREILQSKDVRVTLRQTAGRDIEAACGQLRLVHESTRI